VSLTETVEPRQLFRALCAVLRMSSKTLTIELDTSSKEHVGVVVAAAYKLDGHSAAVICIDPEA
jgi:hypothetical protein